MTRAAAPSPLERAVSTLWSAVLGRPVPVTDSFPALGGDRAAAAELTELVRETFEVSLPVEAVFGPAATVREMAAAIRTAQRRDVPPLLPRPVGAPPAPLSFGQQRLWFLAELAEDTPAAVAYHVPVAFRLHGPLDTGALHAAVRGLVARHEVLRTRIEAEDGVPVQLADPPGPVELPVEDVTGIEAALARAREDIRRPFDLERGPIFRARLLRCGPEEHLLLLGLHHLAIDGASKEILVRELGRFYTAALAGTEPDLPELPVRYADFAAWQRNWMTGDVLDAELAWARERLTGVSGVLPLPADRPRPIEEDRTGAACEFTIDPDTDARLRELGRANGATVFMTLLAATQAFLARLCRVPEVVLGVPAMGRSRPEVEGVVGFFINTLVLRGDCAGDPDFGTLLRRTRDEALGAYAHQDLPFERLVKEFAGRRGGDRNPLVQVLVQLEPEDPVPDLPGVRAEAVENLEGGVRADLELHFHDGAAGLHGQLVHATALFTPDRARSIVDGLLAALTRLSLDPDRPISELDPVRPPSA